jgi:hypothetical protein
MSPKRKILTKPWKSPDEEYCFKTREDAQIYGGDFKVKEQNLEEPLGLIAPRIVGSNAAKYSVNCCRDFMRLFFRLCRSVFLALSLLYFPLFKENLGEYNNFNLSLIMIVASLTFYAMMEAVWTISCIPCKKRASKETCQVYAWLERLYLFGIILLTLNLCFLIGIRNYFSKPNNIACMFFIGILSLSLLMILIYYLFIGWIFSRRRGETIWVGFVFKTIVLFGTGVCCIIFIGFKIYELLIGSIDFWHPSWSITCIFLGIAHGIIYIYELLIRTDYHLQNFCTRFKEDFCGCKEMITLLFFLGFQFSFYIILELMILLKLDRNLPEEWNWLYILTPVYLIVLFDFLRVGHRVVIFITKLI